MALDERLYFYRARPTRWVDGDTVMLDVDLGMHAWWRGSCRILDLWCPELWAPGGVEARSAAAELAPLGADLIVHSQRFDSFGRILGTVWLEGERSLAAEMIAAGHGSAVR